MAQKMSCVVQVHGESNICMISFIYLGKYFAVVDLVPQRDNYRAEDSQTAWLRGMGRHRLRRENNKGYIRLIVLACLQR